MIRQEKQDPALDALHFILVRARTMAYEAGNTELAEILDAAEILPCYFLESEDRTETYREAVQDIADRYACGYALHAFDKDASPASSGNRQAS